MTSQITVGDELFRRTVSLTRKDLVAYAAASGDHNPIHYNDAAASAAGLPGVAASAVEEWAGDPHLIKEISTRFSRPVVVPGDGEASLEIIGTAGEVDAESVRVDIAVLHESKGVLTRARAIVARA